MKTTLQIKGTHCASCKALIEDICLDAGAKSCTVNYVTGETVIEHEGDLDLPGIKKEIESLGRYEVEMPGRAS